MKVYLASDHAGFIYKNEFVEDLRKDGYDVCDLGPVKLNPEDDYPDTIAPLARRIAAEPDSLGIIFGGSGQGEAIVANRTPGVRAVVYCAEDLNVVRVAREHNDANILSIGARFMSLEAAYEAASVFLSTPFPGDERHTRRIGKIDGKHTVQRRIVPAVLMNSADAVAQQERSIRGLFPLFQLDVVDGKYINTAPPSWPIGYSDEDVLEVLRSFVVPFEVDLMVERPEKRLDFWINSPAKRLIFHLGSTERIRSCLERTQRTGREAYVALSLNDKPEWLRPYEDCLDGIQCMGIDPIGVQGAEMDKRAPAFVRQVSDMFPCLPVSVDGGVKLWNSRTLVLHGATQLAVGSGLFTGDPSTNKEAFARALATKAAV